MWQPVTFSNQVSSAQGAYRRSKEILNQMNQFSHKIIDHYVIDPHGNRKTISLLSLFYLVQEYRM